MQSLSNQTAVGPALRAALLLCGLQVFAPLATAQAPSLWFYDQSQARVESVLRLLPPTDDERYARLRTSFSDAGCSPDLMRQQSVPHHAGKNLICIIPGTGDGEIVVAAHYEREGDGDGAVEDWSGAAMLAVLYKSIQAQPRHHTFVFAALCGSEGQEEMLRAWTADHHKPPTAVIALDALGLGPVQFHLFPGLLPNPDPDEINVKVLLALYAERVAQASHQPTEANRAPLPEGLIDDTRQFRTLGIPSILIYSLPPPPAKAVSILAHDTLDAVRPSDYHENYEFMSYYLCSIDRYL